MAKPRAPMTSPEKLPGLDLTRMPNTREGRRVKQAAAGAAVWQEWGPYLSERAWGTVREDYSAGRHAWDYFPHDHARSAPTAGARTASPASRDRHQRLCFALALWNGRDPILKERLFGLTGREGNHGEDVKEYYFYLDSTPTHSYMKCLYKYPQAAFPYARARRGEPAARQARAASTSCSTPASSTRTATSTSWSSTPRPTPEDILVRITVDQPRPRRRRRSHVLPTLWFRNTWSWERRRRRRPRLRAPATAVGAIDVDELGELGRVATATRATPAAALHRERDQRRSGCSARRTPRRYVKDAFHELRRQRRDRAR